MHNSKLVAVTRADSGGHRVTHLAGLGAQLQDALLPLLFRKLREPELDARGDAKHECANGPACDLEQVTPPDGVDHVVPLHFIWFWGAPRCHEAHAVSPLLQLHCHARRTRHSATCTASACVRAHWLLLSATLTLCACMYTHLSVGGRSGRSWE